MKPFGLFFIGATQIIGKSVSCVFFKIGDKQIELLVKSRLRVGIPTKINPIGNVRIRFNTFIGVIN